MHCASDSAPPTRWIELIANVDAVIVGDRHGDLHLAHALPAIAAGKPVFVDKPTGMQRERRHAQSSMRRSEPARHCLSASALRWQHETVILKARLAYLDGPFSIGGYGTWYPDSEYGGAIFYAIHTLELMQELVGTDWSELRVEPGDEPVIRYECERASVAMSFRPLGASGASAFGVSVTSPQLKCDKPIPLPDDYMAPVTDHIATMLRTGRGMDRETLLAPIRMMAEIEALLDAR